LPDILQTFKENPILLPQSNTSTYPFINETITGWIYIKHLLGIHNDTILQAIFNQIHSSFFKISDTPTHVKNLDNFMPYISTEKQSKQSIAIIPKLLFPKIYSCSSLYNTIDYIFNPTELINLVFSSLILSKHLIEELPIKTSYIYI
jgi:hypothetical protein